MQDYIPLLLTGAAGAAIIKMADNIIMWGLARRAKHREAVEGAGSAERVALRMILLDRLQYLCRCYIRAGKVDFDDRRRLHKMHDAYHALGGNGDLDVLMAAVDELPLDE